MPEACPGEVNREAVLFKIGSRFFRGRPPMPQAGPEPSDDGLVDAGLCPRAMNRYPSTKRKSMAAIILRRVKTYESSKVGRAYLCPAFEQEIELWCNGNTADFGSVVLGSNPGSST